MIRNVTTGCIRSDIVAVDIYERETDSIFRPNETARIPRLAYHRADIQKSTLSLYRRPICMRLSVPVAGTNLPSQRFIRV